MEFLSTMKKRMTASADEAPKRASERSRSASTDAGAAEALRLDDGQGGKQYTDSDGMKVVRKRTTVENEMIAHREAAAHIVASVPEESAALPDIQLYLPTTLKDAIFCGHLVTDLDSIAGAIGAAELYGGVPAAASALNTETQFALEKWGVAPPAPIEEVLAAHGGASAAVCLVDHQQTSQLNPAISVDQIVGVIDHHALQSKTIVTDRPIYIDIRPWGSMSSMIAHTFLTHGRRPPTPIAGMLLCAILSDTLNLLGPTTTEWDRLMVAVLADIASVEDIQLLASDQFKAKSRELAGLSAVGLVNGDQKAFGFNTDGFKGEIGFAVVETTDDAVIMDRMDELLPEMVAGKKEKGLDMLFLAVVNIVELRSQLLLCGPGERHLAMDAFGGEISGEGDTIMDLGKLVSRKKDYVPAITKAIKAGWTRPNLPRGPSKVSLSDLGALYVDPEVPDGQVRRRESLVASGNLAAMGAAATGSDAKDGSA